MFNVIVSSDSRYPIDRKTVEQAVLQSLQKHPLRGEIEVEVNIMGDRKMHELNKKYRGIDDTTDVLSFALEDPQSTSLNALPRVGFVASPDKVLRLGSICISYPQAVKEASEEGVSMEEEINFLVDHGISHLMGIHHEE